MGLCFCIPHTQSSSPSGMISHSLSYKSMKGDNNIDINTLIIPSYKSPESKMKTNETVKENEEFTKELFLKSQTEILIKDEGDENIFEENPKKIIRIEDFQLLKVFIKY